MEGIVKVWLQLAADGDESYTSLPCAAGTLGWQLGEKLTASVKKRSGLSIDLGDPTRHQRSSDAGQPLWHVVLKASGAPLKLHEPVLPQLEAAGEKELRLLHAPPPLPTVVEQAPLPSYPVGRCVHASATWSPSQALVSYLACSGLLPVAHAEALSKRCMEEGVVGLDECVNGLLDSIGDLDELRDSQGDEAHDQLIACLRSIQSGSVPDALQERLRPVRRNNGRIRSIIVRDTHHIVATIHATPMASTAAISPALAAATAASSPAAATSPATSSAAAAAPSSTAGSSPPPPPHLLCPANASPPPPVPAPPAAAALAEVGEEGEEDEVDADAEFDMALAAQTRVRCSTSAAPLPVGFRGSIVSPTSLTRNPSPALPATATATTPTAGAAAAATTPKHQSKVSALAAAFSMVDVSAATATPAATPAPAAASAGPAPTISPPPASGTATPTAAALASAPARRPPAAPANGGSTSTSTSTTGAAAATSPSLDALSPSRSSSIAKPANVELVVDSGVLVERAVDWPTVQFDVTKVNERGRRQPRSLRLTSTHIQNVKSHSNISSRHAYDEVWCVTLTDQETLVISYRDSHDYTYISPIAGEIAAEIQGRMTQRREKMKHNLATNLHVMAIKFQEKIHRREQKRIGTTGGNGAATGNGAAAAGAATGSEGQQSFLHSSAAAVVESSLGAMETTTAATFAAVPAPAPSSSPSLPSPTSAAAAAAAAGPRSSIIGAGSALSPRGGSGSSSSKSAQKLQQLFGSTHSQRLQQAIESHILESSSDGGRARARFLRNMPALEKNPSTMLAIVRQFLDSLRAFVENKRGEELRKTMGAGSTGPIPGEEEMDLGARVERAVQGAVVQPAYTRIIATLRRLCAPADEAIALALSKLRAQIGPDQSYYGVPASSHNVHNWQAAIEELNDVDRALLPLDKLKALLHCARAIYSTFNADRTTRNKLAGHAPQLGQYFLSADDFFPSGEKRAHAHT